MTEQRKRHRRAPSLLTSLLAVLLLYASSTAASERVTEREAPVVKRPNTSLTEFTHTLVDRDFYDKHFRAVPPDGGPTIVYVCFHIDSFGPIDVLRMDFSIEVVLHLRWSDQRLRYSGHADRVVLSQLLDEVWRPDVFFQNAKSIERHDLPSGNFLLWLWPNGSLLYSQKLNLRLHCHMDLEDFPFDIQTCSMQISSFGMSTDDLELRWSDNDTTTGVSTDGISFTSPMATFLNEFHPPRGSYMAGTNYSQLTGRNFSHLRANFTLRRKHSYYLINNYLPSILIVLITWSSFAIDYNAAPARVSLSTLSLLALLTETVALERKLPPVSYITALGIWHICCIAFIHLSLLEYMAINLLNRRQKKRLERLNSQRLSAAPLQDRGGKPSDRREGLEALMPPSDTDGRADRTEPADSARRGCLCRSRRRGSTGGAGGGGGGGGRFWRDQQQPQQHQRPGWRLTPARLDLIFLFSYPMAFALFNVVYWCFIIPRNALQWNYD